uniref:Amino acid transporter, putative n=1 Tax=Ixodes scapularis TaxID=6945 RepID=A0A1S4L527_IXOSC
MAFASLSLSGGLCYAEMGSLLPASGGDYAYLTACGKSFGKIGDILPFFYAWSFVIILDPMTAALQGLTFSNYALSVVYRDCSPPYSVTVMVALAFISLATAVNCFSVKTSARVQDVLSVIKCLVLIAIIITGAAFATRVLQRRSKTSLLFRTSSLYYAHYGFQSSAVYKKKQQNNIAFIAGEITDPTRNLPRALLCGILTVTAIYVLTNVAYFIVLDAATVINTEALAVTFATVTWGPVAATVIPIAVSVCAFGTLFAASFVNARVILAAARQGHLPAACSLVSVKTSVPLAATLLRGILSLAYTFAGSVGFIVESCAFLYNVYEICGVLCLFVLRSSMKDAPRLYRAPTVLALLKLLISMSLVIMPLVNVDEYMQYVLIAAVFGAGAVYYTVFVVWGMNIPGARPLTLLVQKLLMSATCANELESLLKDKM